MSDTESEESESQIEVKLEGTTFTRLTEIVRNQYLKYLKKQLENNLITCCREVCFTNKDDRLDDLVKKCAQNLEDMAIKEATLTQLYQRAMVKTINTVRRCTNECRLLEEMELILNFNDTKTFKVQTATKATQTEDYEISQILTLDERIELFQKHLNRTQSAEKESLSIELNSYKSNIVPKKRRTDSHRYNNDRKRFSCTRLSSDENKVLEEEVWHSPTPPPLPATTSQPNISSSNFNAQSNETFEEQLEGDEVAEELEKLFMEQEIDLEEIFGISLKSELSNCDTKAASKTEYFVKTPSQLTNSVNTQKISSSNVPTNKSNEMYRPLVDDLRHSPWPCECFMQKRRLSATLTRLVEEDIRWFDILKMQFTLLFGEDDSHDDFAPCSPSLELDEIITSSCMRRISPWVVGHLMKPLEDGLIGNRFLFKKLAKKLAFHIISANQYPTELVIKNAVENFFCLHNAVMSVDDLNDIDAMTIVNSE